MVRMAPTFRKKKRKQKRFAGNCDPSVFRHVLLDVKKALSARSGAHVYMKSSLPEPNPLENGKVRNDLEGLPPFFFSFLFAKLHSRKTQVLLMVCALIERGQDVR
jgi:hypothetical protein